MKKSLWGVLVLITMCGAGTARAQAPVADYYSTLSKLGGKALPAGTSIEAFDEEGNRCGYAQANADGAFLIHVYGNDPMTAGIDEGAREGEMLTWKLAGIALESEDTIWIATLVGMFGDLRFENGAAKEIQLDGKTTAVQPATWASVKETYRGR